MKILSLALILGLMLVGCQLKPTKVTQQEPVMSDSQFAEKIMKDRPVLLDVRPAFEFNLSHVPGAVNVRWEDFSQQDPRSRGLLDKDLFGLARRLSLIGIDPETKVVVLGKGTQGAGEEGRIAWTLKVLGVREVYTLVHSSYRAMNPKEEPLVQNKPYWKPQIQEALTVSYKEFKNLVEKAEPGTVVLDVRLPEEFKLRNISATKGVKAPVEYLEWKDFFGEKGLPTPAVTAKLAAKGITKDTRILVISNHGVRSGAVTYALQFLGFEKARNFAGGYEQWK